MHICILHNFLWLDWRLGNGDIFNFLFRFIHFYVYGWQDWPRKSWSFWLFFVCIRLSFWRRRWLISLFNVIFANQALPDLERRWLLCPRRWCAAWPLWRLSLLRWRFGLRWCHGLLTDLGNRDKRDKTWGLHLIGWFLLDFWFLFK